MYSAKVTRQTQSKKSIESGESRSSRRYRSEFSRHLWKTSALSTIALAGAGAAHAQDALWQPQVQTIIGGDHQGAYSSLEGFIPLTQTADSVVFLDLRLKHDFSEGTGGDVGLGLRRVVNPDLILGGYAYLNVERLDGHQFTGATLGVEAIATNFDAHVNVHLPFGDQGRETSTSASSLSLVGNQLLEQISVLNRRDYASWGVEGEFGVQAPIDLPKDHALRLHVGGYHFEDAGNTADSVTGGKAGFEYKVGNVLGDSGASLTFGGEVRYDDRDDTTFAGFARLTIPLGGTQRVADGDREPLYNVSEGLRKRANERVRGDIGVRLDTDDTTASLSRRAINARTGSEFGLFFFADGENTLGLGTLGDPTTLDDAVTRAGSGFVVALGGSGNLLTGGVTLTNGQTVIGGGQTVQAILRNGTISSFALGGSDGIIQGTSPANPVLSLGNGNTLQAITVTGGEVGILGNNINGATLTGVAVDGTASHGASFTGTSTGVNASNFSATDNGGDGLHIEGDGTYNFTGTTLLSGNAVDGLSITGNGTYNFQTVNALNNTDDGIEVTSATGTFKTTGGTISGNGDVGVKIDPINANVVLTSITHSRGTSGVILDDVTGSFTVTGATTISNTSGAAIAISNSPASIRFADITITDPGADAITFAGINGPVVVGGVVISGLGTGATGLDFSGSRTTFTAQSVNITGTGAASSTGIDLSGTQVGSAITITNGGTIANVDTGVRLGIAGSLANTANANFSFGGGSVGGITASLDARGLNPLTGTYAFGSTTFNAPQLFSTANIVFVGSTATGAGDGSSVNDLATIGAADANAGADAIFVLVNDGLAINDADGFTLGDGQTLASFGNGAEYALGGVPLNVTGDNVQNGVVQGDPTGNGAATLTNLGVGDTVVLGDGTVIANITISNGAGGVGILGDNIDGATLTGVTVAGASLDGALFTGTSTNVGGSNFTSTGNGGAGLLIESDGVFTFSGTTTLSGNAVDGLTIFGDGDYSFETLNLQNNAGSGLAVFAATRASLSIAGGTIAGNDDTAAFISGTDLDVTLDSITHDNPAAGLGGLLLLDVGGRFAVTGATTIGNVVSGGILILSNTADISFGGPVAIDGVNGVGLSISESAGTVVFEGAVDIGNAGDQGVLVNLFDGELTFSGAVDIHDVGSDGIVIAQSGGLIGFNAPLALNRAGSSGILMVNNPGVVMFGDVLISDPGKNGVDVIGVNGTINFGDIDVTGLDATCGCDAAGLNLAGSRSTFTAASLDVSGNNSAGTTGVDLSGTTGGSVTITNGGTIANVDTGVQLGTNGVGGATASTDFVFGGGSIEGLTASLDARGLNPLAGSYGFGATVFSGPQLFDSSNIIFVGSVATGAGDGTSVNDLAAIGTADANTDSGAVFVLVNDGTAVDDADGFTLDDGQTLASFGNGAQYALGGIPLNVTGANVVHGVIQDDPTGNGAATLINLGAGDTVVLGDGTIIADINLAGTGAGIVVNLGNRATLDGVVISGGTIGIFGNNINDATLTNIAVSGAGLHGASFSGTSTNVNATNFTATGNDGSGLSIGGGGAYTFAGTTTLSNNRVDGLTIAGNGSYSFGTLTAADNGAVGLEVVSGGSLSIANGTVSGNTVFGVYIADAALDVTLTSVLQVGGTSGILLDGVSGSLSVTGGTIANVVDSGIDLVGVAADTSFTGITIDTPGLHGISIVDPVGGATTTVDSTVIDAADSAIFFGTTQDGAAGRIAVTGGGYSGFLGGLFVAPSNPGTYEVAVSGGNFTAQAGGAVVVDGCFCVGDITITEFDGFSAVSAGATTAGVLVNMADFDIAAPGGAITIGSAADPALFGLLMTDVTGTLNVSRLDVTSMFGPGLGVDNVFLADPSLFQLDIGAGAIATGDQAIFLANLTADIALDSVSTTGSFAEGILLADLSGSFTVSGSTDISHSFEDGLQIIGGDATITFGGPLTVTDAGDDGIDIEDFGGTANFNVIQIDTPAGDGFALNDNAGALTFGNTTILNPGFAGIDVNGTNGAITFGNIDITDLGTGTGLELAGSMSTFTAAVLNITGTDVAGSAGIDLSGTLGGSVTITNGGTIADVDTGVQMGTNGIGGATANTDFTFGGSSIEGITASLDMRGLDAASGTYSFGTTTFSGPQLFDATDVVFVGRVSTGAGDGSSVNDLINADLADNLGLGANTVFVLVGTAPAEIIDTDADGFTLAAGQSLVSFANGATVDIGGPPANVTGANVVTGATLDDPFLQGAPTLNNAAGNTIDLSDSNVIANLIATSGLVAVDGSGITGLNSSGVVIRGAATGVFLDGALGTVTINNLDIQGPVQTGIVLANSAATVDFTGTTQIAGGTIAGLRVDNFDGTADFADLDITGGNLGIGILNGSSGTLTFGTGSSVVNTSGVAVSVGGSTATVNYNGTITQNNAASAVRVDAITGGSVNFGGFIIANTGAANAIDLTGNTGSAINFSGGLNLNTDGGFAFRAVDGGTLTVTGGSNTISTGAGVSENGMTIGGTGMTIGAGGVNFASVTVDGSGGATQTGINIQNTSGGPVTFGSVDISRVAAATGTAIRLSNVAGAYAFNGTTTITTTGEFTSGLVVENSAIDLTVANLLTTSVFRYDVALTNNTGIISISDGTIANSGTGDGVAVSGGSATISVGADITNAGFSSTAAVRVDGITGGSAVFTGTLSATAGGDLFRIGNTTALTGGEVSFSGASLTATGGGGGVVGALGAGAVFDASAPLSITGGALVVQNVAGSATFGAITMSGGTGIGLSGNAGTLTFGTTNVALGAFPNTSGIRFSGTNTDVTFGQTTITGVGTDQTGINFTGSETTAIFGVTSITGTGALTGRGIDLSSTLNNRAISFATGSSISNIGIGVDLSRSLATATTANANFTFGDGSSAIPNGRFSTISAAAGGFTVNAIGLDPASGNYNFDDVTFTGNANLPLVANAVILVSQGGGFISAGTFGLSQTVDTISLAAAQALSGTETFAFVGAIDLSTLGTAFTLDAGQSITGFGNGNAVSTGVEQPANVSGDLGGFGGNVTADEAVVDGGANDMFQLYGDNEIRHTTFDFTGGAGAIFFIDGADAAFNNGGITIEGVTIQDVAASNFAFETTGLQSSLSILNNDINIAGQLISLSGGTAGDVSIARGTLPNSATPGVLTSSGVSASNFGGSASFTDMTVSGTAAALNAIDINQTSNTGTFNFSGLNIGSFAVGATGNGIDIDASGFGGVNLNLISGNSITSPGDGLHVRHSAAAAAVALSLDNTTWRTTGASSHAVDVLSLTPNSTYVTSLDANTVTANGVGGGMVFNQVTFDADGNPGTVDTVSASGTTNIGQGMLANQRVQGAGLSFVNVSGVLAYESLNIFNNAGTGLEVDTKSLGTTFTLAVNSGGAGNANIDTTGGMALLLDPLTVDMEFDSITASGGTNGILFDQVDGTFAVTGNTSITGTSGFGISAINTNAGTFSFNAVTIDNDAVGNGGGIGWASGALATSGLVTIDTTSGAGVSQSGGSTAFSGGLDIQTGSGTGFNATGGSIAVAASGGTERISTVTGQILSWIGTTIGAGNVSFDTLSASGIVANDDAILLSDVDGGTFNGGGVTVIGTAAGDGIEISGASSAAFNFASATIGGTAGNGIFLNGSNGVVTFTTATVANTTLAGVRIDNNTDAVNLNGGSINSNGIGVDINIGSGDVTIDASVNKTTAGDLVEVSLRTGGTVSFGGNLSATALSGGIDVNGNAAGIIEFSGNSKSISTGTNTAVSLLNNDGATINFSGGGLVVATGVGTGISVTGGGEFNVTGTGNSVTTGVGTAFLNLGNGNGSAAIDINAALITGAGRVVDIQNRTANNLTLSGAITNTAAGALGILVQTNSAGIIDLSGVTKTLTTGANTAVTLANNTGTTISFSGGGLNIDTTSGTGFNATGGGTINVTTGANPNTINTTTGQILDWQNVSVGTATFAALATSDVAGAGDAILLSNVDGGIFNGGNVIVAGTAGGDGIDISGGSSATFNFASATIDNTSAHGINLTGANGAVTFTTVNIDGTTGSGLNIANSTAGVTISDGTIGGTIPAIAAGVAISSQVSGTIALNGLAVTASSADAYSFTGNAGTINVAGGSAAQNGIEDVFDINSGSGTITVSAAITHSGASGQAVEIDGTSGAVTFSGNIVANAGAQLFNIGATTAPTTGTITFSGASLTATNGGNAVITGLGAGATVNISGTVSVTGSTNAGISLANAAGNVSFGAVIVTNSADDGISIADSTGTLSFNGQTRITNPGVNGVDIEGTNGVINFANLDIALQTANTTGLDLSAAVIGGNITATDFDVTSTTAIGTLGVNAVGTTRPGAQVVRLGDNSTPFNAGQSASISGVARGVQFSSTSNFGLIFGDSEGVDDTGSSISATGRVIDDNGTGLPAGGSYDFDDVVFTGDTSNLSAVSVYYVDPLGTGNGSLATPGSIAGAELSSANVIVLVDRSLNGSSGLIDMVLNANHVSGGAINSFDLDDGQVLISFASADGPIDVSTLGIVGAGAPGSFSFTTITNSTVINAPGGIDTVRPTLTTSVGNTVNLATTGVGIITGGIQNVLMTNTGATGDGIQLYNDDLSSFFIRNNTITAIANAIDIWDMNTGGLAVDTLSLFIDGNTLRSTQNLAAGFDGQTLSPTTSTVAIRSFADNVVVGGATGGGGILFSGVTFDSDGATAGNQVVNAGTLTVGTVGTRLQGAGLSMVNVSGTLSFADVDIANNNGTGLSVNAKTTTFNLAVNSGGANNANVDTTNGMALFLDPLTVDMVFASVNSTNSGTYGIQLDAVAGSLTINGGNLNGATTAGLGVSNSTGTFTFNNVDITNGAGDGDGIVVTNSATATLNFTDLDILATATDSDGFIVDASGGTINVTGLGNSISVANAEAVNFDGGTLNVLFDTVNSTAGGTRSGIELDGISGTLTVTGGIITKSGADGAAVDIGNNANNSGGNATIAIGAALNNSGTGRSVLIQELSGGSVTLSGNINDTGAGLSISGINNGTAASVTLSGASKIFNTGANTAIDLGTGGGNGAGTISFTNGGLVVTTTSGRGFHATAGGTINVSGASNTIATQTGQVLDWTGVSVGAGGATFASLSAAGAVAADAILLDNVDGAGNTFNGGAVTIAGTSGVGSDGLVITGGSAATFQFSTTIVNDTSARGIALIGANGAVTFSRVEIDDTGNIGLEIGGNTNAVAISDGFIGETVNSPTTTGSQAVVVSGGGSTVNIAANIVNTAVQALSISGRSSGTVNVSGSITDTGSGVSIAGNSGTAIINVSGNLSLTGTAGISVLNNTGGTINFGGATKSISTGVNTAVSLTNNAGATINFTGGGLDIDTTTGTGFVATGGGIVNVGDANNSIATTTGTAINLNGITIGAGNFEVGVVDVNGGAVGVQLTNVTGGSFNISGGTIQNTTTTAIDINGGTSNVSIDNATIINSAGRSVSVVGRSGGTITFGPNLNLTDTGQGMFFQNNTGGSTSFSGSGTRSINVAGANNALTVINSAGHTVSFSGTTTIQTTGSGNAIDISNGATLAFTGSAINATGTGVALQADGGGTVVITGTGALSAGATATAVNLGGVAIGGVTFASTNTIAGAATNAVTMTNVTGGTVVLGSGTLGATTGAVVSISGGTAGLTYSGNVNQSNNAALVSVGGGHATGTITFQTGTLNATNGTGLQFDNADGTYNFNGTATLNGGDAGIDIVNGSGGAFTFASGTTITNPSGVGFLVNGGGGNITYSGTISKNSAGRMIDIQSRTGGTTTFSGNLSATASATTGIFASSNTGGTFNFSGATKTLSPTGRGVDLQANTGATFNFTNGGLAITTTNLFGFNASGGGTVTVTGSNNTISSTTGAALNIVSTNIGAADVTFRSISSNGAASGIILNATGTSGGLTVTGDGGGSNNGSGGTIQNSIGDGISLTNTTDVNLARMNITNNLGDGIGGSTIDGMVLNRLNISGNGNDAGTDESGINIAGLTGAGSGGLHPTAIMNSVISNNFEFEIQITNSSGTLTNLQFLNNAVTANVSAGITGNVFNFLGTGTSTMGLTVTGGSFTGNWNPAAPPADITGTGVHADTSGTAMTVNVSGATFAGNNAGVNVSTGPGNSTLTFDISNNTFIDQRSVPINIFNNGNAPFGRTVNGTITGNVIGDGTDLSGSTVGRGIDVGNEGAVNMTVLISGNTIQDIGTLGVSGGQAIASNIGLVGQATGGGTTNLTITNNLISDIRNSRAILVDESNDLAGPQPTVFVNISGNTISGVIAGQAGDGSRIRLDQDNGTFRVTQGAPGSGAGSLDTANTGVTAAQISIGGTVLFNQGTPPLPTTNPLPLLAGPGGVGAAGDDLWGDVLTGDTLDSIIAAAIQRWAATGLTDEQLALLNAVTFDISDLGGNYLGLADGGIIRLDDDGNGAGWYVDATPLDDEEFANRSGTRLLADGTQAPAGQYDLLTTVMHEFGHMLGMDDTYAVGQGSALMHGWLQTGERRLPNVVYTPQEQYYSTSVAE